MNRLPPLPVLLALLGPAFAQETDCPIGTQSNCYQVLPTTNAFTSIAGLAGSNLALAPPFDDGDSALVPIPPATFSYCAVEKVGFVINSNGFLRFSGPAATSSQNRHPGDPASPNEYVAPFWEDLIGTVAAGSGVWWMVSAGVTTVEWNNVLVKTGAGAGAGSLTFQAKLYPSSDPNLPNRIAFHYDRTSTFPPLAPCGSTSVPSTVVTSATIGVEDVGGITGLDASERGAANAAFPPKDLLFHPAVFTSPNFGQFSPSPATYSVAAGGVDFCHIETLPGTTVLPTVAPFCVAGACFDEDNSGRLQGTLIPLPWKFTVYGRPVKAVNMNANGLLLFGPGVLQGFLTNVSGSGSLPNLYAGPWWDDLEGDADSKICWRVDGLPGCRIMTFEWHGFRKGAGAFSDCVAGAGPAVSFQVRLFEGSAGATIGPACPPATLIGDGNDRIEFWYGCDDWPGGAISNFNATAGIENFNGSTVHACLGGDLLASPGCPGAYACIFDPCDCGTVRFHGDPTPAMTLCTPEIRTNGVPPVRGNPFALWMSGMSPGDIAVLALDFAAPVAPLTTAVPCAGLPTPFGTLWINPPPAALTFVLPTVSVGGPSTCTAAAYVNLPIPNVAALACARVYAQFVHATVGPTGLVFGATEGAKIVIQ